MSRGISWRQRHMLEQLDRLDSSDPVAWRNLDYGSTDHETDPDYYNNRVTQWNIEQAQRRSLRNLEARGLVTLGQWVFMPIAEMKQGALSPHIEWVFQSFKDHVPGESRYMTGVELTDEGRRVARRE